MSDNDNVQTALDAGQRLAGVSPRLTWIAHPDDPEVKIPVALCDQGDGASAVVVLDDAMKALDERMAGPLRRSGTIALTEVDSFIAFVLRWGNPKESAIYANTSAMAFVAVLDDHPPGEASGEAAWRQHRATYACPRSTEWKAWTERDGRAMRQTEFADFLESRLEDMVAGAGFPSPLDVLQVARQLHIVSKGTYTRSVDPTTGDNILVNKTETETGSTVIPRAFLIAIPVFEGGDRYQLEARMRFTMQDGAPQFSYVLHRRAEVERDAFGKVRQKINDDTKLPLFAGTP